VVDQSQSNSISGKPSGINANWRTTFVYKASFCRLRQEDLTRIRSEQAKFIGQSGIPEEARVEWYLTWPQKSVSESKDSQKSNRRTVRHIRSRQDLRATEIGDEIWNCSGTPALDAMVSRIFEHQGRRPRALRHLEIGATAPGYMISLGVGSSSRLSPRTIVRCETPGTEMPEYFSSISEIVRSRSGEFRAAARFSIWILALLIIVMLPAGAIPAFYVHFQHVSNRDNTTGAAFWSAVGYLIVVYIIVLLARYLTAARVVLPRAGRFGGVKAVFSRAGSYITWSETSASGPLRRHLTLAGSGLVGAGLTALLAYVVATASANTHNAPTWPYWLFVALIIIGVIFYLFSFSRFRRKPRKDNANAEEADLLSWDRFLSNKLARP
jgi:hypothetical protein